MQHQEIYTRAFELSLPKDYRMEEILAFHRRDDDKISEVVTDSRIMKGVIVEGVCVVFDITWNFTTAQCKVLADRPFHSLEAQTKNIALGILGLRIDPEKFARFVEDDPLLGAHSRAQVGLRIPQSATPFEALTWAIIGQQINLKFATTLRRQFILLAGSQHSSGLWCYPEAEHASVLRSCDLTSRKFSKAKAETLIRLASMIANREINLAVSQSNSLTKISNALLSIKGIGPWTVNYGLMRGYGYPDCSLHGDAGVRLALQRLQGSSEKLTIEAAEKILAKYKPYRSMAAAHLWATLH